MTAAGVLVTAKLDQTYWGKKIIAAESRGTFTQSNIDQAGEWQTCACGKQDPRLPRDEFDCPTDFELIMAGRRFYSCVSDNFFLSAAETLIEIETRATAILAETLKSTALTSDPQSDGNALSASTNENLIAQEGK